MLMFSAKTLQRPITLENEKKIKSIAFYADTQAIFSPYVEFNLLATLLAQDCNKKFNIDRES